MSILEFDTVRARIRSFAQCSLGKQRIESLGPYPTIGEATLELNAVDEMLRYIYRYGTLPYGGITDVRSQLKKAGIGGVLSASDLLAVAEFIRGGRSVREAVQTKQENLPLPSLWSKVSGLFDARQTEIEIRQTIDEDGLVMDSASPQLHRLRQERRELERRVRQVLENMLRTHQKYLQDPVIAMRGSSLCLPVRVEYKNQVPGAIHDYSASGATVFIEPRAAMEANLRVRELALEEEREIERILQRVSGVVALVSDSLLENAEVLSVVDAWTAKSAYAKSEKAECPVLRDDGVWNLVQARHPLLDKEVAVPISLELGNQYRLLLVTGPNTGGKTVALKTLGLLTLMAMCGCFIPAASGSEVGFCDDIFVDIGDEQSIEQSLSTFSSHMRTIVATLEKVSKDSLVLLDELGAGTDPTEGAALAIAILDELKFVGCRVMATTHYAQLKGYAFGEPAAINASVEFDIETLRPTYRLLIGVPGRSNAIAIASRLGLHGSIVDRARAVMTHGDIRIDELTARMEEARKQAEDERDKAELASKEAERLREEWRTKWSTLEEQSSRLRESAQHEASRIVETATREANRLIDELRKLQKVGGAKDHELVNIRKGIEELRPTASGEARPRGRGPKDVREIAPGATVRVNSLGQNGEVLEKDGATLVVQLGLLRTKVDLSDVEFVRAPKTETKNVSTRRGVPREMKLSLDIRGETVDDALPQIDKYLDDALVNGIERVTIIHGKGTGALRDGVRRYLARHPRAASFLPGGPGEGGDGATVVTVH